MTVRPWTILPALLITATGMQAQTMSLAAALEHADRSAYQNRIAAGNARVQHGQATAALRGILPSVRVEGGFARTTDPIGAFGTRLRQRSIDPADFDPARLNRPGPIANYPGSVVLEQPLFNADAFLGRRAALRGVAASRASTDWTRSGTSVDVIRAYFGATLAREKVATLSDAARAAQSHVRQAEAMVRNGLATKSDALLAAIRAGDVEAQLADADAQARTAVLQFGVVLGLGDRSTPTLPDRLPSVERIRAITGQDTLTRPGTTRADVEAALRGVEAARLDVQRARSLYLPRLNGFARYDWNSANRPFAGEKSWTVGLLASWTPFAGASEIAERRSAGGRADVARAMADAAVEGARLDAEETLNAVRAAFARLAIAERAVQQSEEAHRIVARKYAGGLATVTELLDAAAVETQSALGLSAARYALIASAAEHRRAIGLDPASLAELDVPNTTSSTTRNPSQ